MALSPVLFKFSEINFLDYQSYDILAHITVAGQVNFGFSPELAEQMTGPSNFPIETEVSTIATEASITLRNFDPDQMKATMGAVTRELLRPTVGGSEVDRTASGSLDIVQDGIGETSGNVIGTGGIADSIAVSSDAGPAKAGLYRLEITDGAMGFWELKSLGAPGLVRSDYSDVENRIVQAVSSGTDNVFTASGTEANVDLSIGVRLPNMATSPTAAQTGKAIVFRVSPPGSRAFTTEIGQENLQIPKIKVQALSRRMSDGRFGELLAHNAILPGINFAFSDDFSESEISGKLIYDLPTRKVADFSYYCP